MAIRFSPQPIFNLLFLDRRGGLHPFKAALTVVGGVGLVMSQVVDIEVTTAEEAARQDATAQFKNVSLSGNALTAQIQDRTYRLTAANQVEFQSGKVRYVFDYATNFAVIHAQDTNTTRILTQGEMPEGGQWHATKEIGCAMASTPAARPVVTAQQFKKNFC